MKNLTKQWLDQAQYDFITAKAMLASKRYLYVAYLCQQTIEKDLKAAIVENGPKHPPRIHNLTRLAADAGLAEKIAVRWPGLLVDLTPFAIEARYPEYREQMNRLLDRAESQNIIRKTGELHRWLRKPAK